MSAPPRRRRAAVTVAALAAGLLAGPPAAAAAAPGEGDTHRVKEGDTLARIARKHDVGGKPPWRRLFDANRKIHDPDHIEVGQRLRIPGRKQRLPRRAVPQPAPTVRPSAGAAPQSGVADGAAAGDSNAVTAPVAGVWQRLAACESGGNWSANTGNGYYGGLQFSLASWRAVGGSGMPHEASPATQIAMGERLRAAQGWGAWPSCASRLGLR